MGFRGKGRDVRQAFLDQIREEDPALADRLEELRTRKPQAYRKRLRAMAKERGFRVAVGGRWLHMGTTPGRETDPEARIGPAREEPMDRKRYLFTPGREMEPEHRAELAARAAAAAGTASVVSAAPMEAAPETRAVAGATEAAPAAKAAPLEAAPAAEAPTAEAAEAAPKKGRAKKAKA